MYMILGYRLALEQSFLSKRRNLKKRDKMFCFFYALTLRFCRLLVVRAYQRCHEWIFIQSECGWFGAWDGTCNWRNRLESLFRMCFLLFFPWLYDQNCSISLYLRELFPFIPFFSVYLLWKHKNSECRVTMTKSLFCLRKRCKHCILQCSCRVDSMICLKKFVRFKSNFFFRSFFISQDVFLFPISQSIPLCLVSLIDRYLFFFLLSSYLLIDRHQLSKHVFSTALQPCSLFCWSILKREKMGLVRLYFRIGGLASFPSICSFMRFNLLVFSFPVLMMPWIVCSLYAIYGI